MLTLPTRQLGIAALALAASLPRLTIAAEQPVQYFQAERHDTSRPLRELIAEMDPTPPLLGEPPEIPNVFPKTQRRANIPPEVGPLRSLGVQTQRSGTSAPPITFSFNGIGIGTGGGGVPPDTNGDASPNEYIQWVNVSWAIIDKVTGQRSNATAGNSFWAGFGGP